MALFTTELEHGLLTMLFQSRECSVGSQHISYAMQDNATFDASERGVNPFDDPYLPYEKLVSFLLNEETRVLPPAGSSATKCSTIEGCSQSRPTTARSHSQASDGTDNERSQSARSCKFQWYHFGGNIRVRRMLIWDEIIPDFAIDSIHVNHLSQRKKHKC